MRPKTGLPTMLDLRLGHLTPEQRAEIDRRIIPPLARIVRRLLTEQEPKRAAAGKQST